MDTIEFSHRDLLDTLETCDAAALDALDFGVVGMDPAGVVDRYNLRESALSGLSAARVLGRNFFTEVAPCTNNYMVAHRYESMDSLDETIPYVFTLRMRPRKVELRLLKRPDVPRLYLLVRDRLAAPGTP